MRVGKQRAPPRQSIDVGRERVGMSAETADPVVHIVDGDKEDVGTSFVGICRLGQRGEGYDREEGEEDVFHES